MPSIRSALLAALAAALVVAGCGGSDKDGAAKPSHDSAEGAMAGLLAAMKTGDNKQVFEWVAPTPTTDRTSITGSERMSNALGLGGKLFWEAEKLTIKTAKESGQSGTVTLSAPIVWCFGDGPTDAKATCAQPNGATGQTPVYKAVKQGGKWYVDLDINKGRNLPNNPAVSKSGPAPAPAEDTAGIKTELLTQGQKYNAAQLRFFKQVAQDARAENLSAVKADASQFRDAVFEFDGEVRKIEFPSSLQSDVNRLLEGDRTLIAELDAMGEADSFVEFAPLLKRVSRDRKEAIGAFNALVAKL